MASVVAKGSDGLLKRIVSQRPGLSAVVLAVVLGAIAFVVLYPLLILLFKSFAISELGVKPASTGLGNW